ncbi:MAG: carboxypeptidase-like regulatory domain-containing protein [Sphingobacteriaceae bacterium]|nr:carboxypeptidase-like regulatory domain-containing protein [Sphingobacteriaceae bacterium]
MKNIFLITLFALSAYCTAQEMFTISGKIYGDKEELPFATIIVQGGTYGTNSNENGAYKLKLPKGDYQLIFQYVGFGRKIIPVNLNSNQEINVTLKQDGISLKEIEVKAGEDPAYPIMRKVLKKRKFFLEQVNAFTCMAYIKGLQRISKIPKNLGLLMKLGGGEAEDTSQIKGVVYLSECISKYHFRKPDEEKEIMYASKVSGNNKAFSFNKLGDMDINFYENLINMGGLSARPIISPLNDNAFFFYKFYLLGKIEDEGKIISKIKVVPKRKTDPCFRGIIYIQDSTWRITGADLMLTKETKINFVDTLHVKQLCASVIGDSIWMPVTINFSFDFNAFGVSGKGYFNAHIKDYDLNPIYPDNFFKNEVLQVEEKANKKDSAYWNAYRPVPLTEEEQADYREKDSIEVVHDSPRYQDSIDKKRNRFEFSDVFMGYNYQKSKKDITIQFPGIIANGIQYNTVEGLNLSYKFSLEKDYENKKHLNINGKCRYGFANELWGGEAGIHYRYNPKKFSRIGMNLKSIVEQYNQQDPIIGPVNSIYSLLVNENYMKLYKESGGEISYFSEISNGIFFHTVLKYVERESLQNKSDQLIIDDTKKLFTSNDPLFPNTHDSLFSLHNAFTTDFTFSFRFKQKYSSLPDQKWINGSKYPRLSITYKKAIPVLESVVDYDLISANLSDRIRLGLFGNFRFSLKGGYFINAKNMYLMDQKNFNGNQTIILNSDYLGSYRLLPYYSFSSSEWFFEVHAEHHFNGFIINKIPVFKRLKIQEVAGVHFLANEKLPQYIEANFGIEKLFRFIRVEYVLGFEPQQKVRNGILVGFKLEF